MTETELINCLKEQNINLSKAALSKLNTYADYLLEYNEHTNLTAIKTKEEVYLKHFYDSLTLTYLVKFTNETLLDVGTGAGFPGLVLAIVYPNLKVTLLDSNNKKIAFLNSCITKLQLTNVEVIYSRAEDYTRTHRETFDYVTSRAVADLRLLLEINIPCLKVNGNFLVMKGNLTEELKDSQHAIDKLHCKIIKEKIFDLPKESGKRTLLLIEKEAITDKIYPRTYDKIKKKPI